MLLVVTEETFEQEVLTAPQPVIVNFWAPWCGVCRWVDPILMRLQSFAHDRVKCVSINADQNFRLSNTYRLTTLPTLLIFDQGIVHQRIEGFQGRDILEQSLTQSLGLESPGSPVASATGILD